GKDHVESRRDLSRPHDRAGGRRGAAEDAERDRAQHPARRPDHYFPAGGSYTAAVRHLFRIAADGFRAGLAAGMPDSYHDRRIALGHWHRGYGSTGAA